MFVYKLIGIFYTDVFFVTMVLFVNDETYYLKKHKSQRNGEIKGDMLLYVPNTRDMCLVLFL